MINISRLTKTQIYAICYLHTYFSKKYIEANKIGLYDAATSLFDYALTKSNTEDQIDYTPPLDSLKEVQRVVVDLKGYEEFKELYVEPDNLTIDFIVTDQEKANMFNMLKVMIESMDESDMQLYNVKQLNRVKRSLMTNPFYNDGMDEMFFWKLSVTVAMIMIGISIILFI